MAGYLPRQSISGLSIFPRRFWLKTSFIPTFVRSRLLPVKYARWWNHVTVRLRKNHNSSSRVACTLGVAVTTIIAVNNVISTAGWHCVPENLLVTCVEIGSRKCGRCVTRLSNRSRNARRRRPQRGRMNPWTTPLNCTHPRTDFRPPPSRERMTGWPGRRTTRQERTTNHLVQAIPREVQQDCVI